MSASRRWWDGVKHNRPFYHGNVEYGLPSLYKTFGKQSDGCLRCQQRMEEDAWTRRTSWNSNGDGGQFGGNSCFVTKIKSMIPIGTDHCNKS